MQSSEYAKALRRESRWAEKLIWKHVRDRKMDGHKFRRQHSVGPYILDFYCPEMKYAIEADGREHGEPDRMAKDEKRDRFLRDLGIRTKRVWNFQLRENLFGVLEAIRADLACKQAPHPNPLPEDGARE